MPIAESLIDLIHERGPLTVAVFMDFALHHPEYGYYARAAQRSGRAGDFFTSVDVGPLFGDLLERQIAEMEGILRRTVPSPAAPCFDLVEAGAGNGRLSADILSAARLWDDHLYSRIQLHLVESSATARRQQRATLGAGADRLVWSDARLPDSYEGVLLANEFLDAMPVHQVVMRHDGLKEVYVGARPEGSQLTLFEGPLSTSTLGMYLDRLGIQLEPGWRVEINLRAVDWLREAARRLRRGFIILIDYGHEARELYSVTHAGGTLTTFARHTMAGPESPTVAWLLRPGEQDITAHVDFTSVRAAAEAEGLVTLGFLDQTYFLMGLLGRHLEQQDLLALKTLLMPGGLGSTLKVLILGKGVGTPALRGCSYRMRVT